MKYYKAFIIFTVSIFSGCGITDNNPANNITSVYLFDSYITRESLNNLLSNKLVNYSVPIRIYVDGEEFKGTTEAQGSGSRYLPKWSYEIELNKKRIAGLYNFNLSAQAGDHSMLRTTLASFVYREMGFEVFSSDYAFLKINEENKGLYYIIERVEEDFFKRRGMPVYEVIKTLFGAIFTFAGGTNLNEFFEKEINDNDNLYNFENFIHALDTVKPENIFAGLEQHLDINSYLKYHAAATIIAAKDGFRNNIIFYKKTPLSPYEVLPWDFDGTFNPTFNEVFAGDNELIRKLLLNDSCLALYKAYYSYCLENIFTEENFFPLINVTIEQMRLAYELDPYLGEAGYDINSEAEKLKNFISERRGILISSFR